MDDLFAFLVLLSMLAIVVGMLNPRWVIRWGSNKTRRNVLKTYALLMVGSFILFGVFSETSSDTSNEAMAPVVPQTTPITSSHEGMVSPPPSPVPAFNIDEFRRYVGNLNGGRVISQSTVESNVARIQYHKSYEEYLTANPQSHLQKQDFENYWATGDAINKALMENSIRLFKEFPALDEVDISLPYDGKEFMVSLAKTQAEEFLGVDFQRLHDDRTNDLWRQEVSNKFFNPKDRGRFIDQFVTVGDVTDEDARPVEPTTSAGPTESNETKAANPGDEYSTEYKLAVIQNGGYLPESDPLVGKFRSHLESISKKTGEEWNRIGDVAVTAHKLMKEKRVNEDLLTVTQAIDGSLPDELEPGTIKLEEIASAYVVLRTGGQ